MKLIGLDDQKLAIAAAVSRNDHVLLEGEAGTGKTSAAIEALGDREYYRIPCDGGFQRETLLGSRAYDGNRTLYEEGILPQAMREGKPLIMDEINACLADVLFALHPVLEKPSTLTLPETKERITPKSGFCVIATMNPSHEYSGTQSLNAALYSRFALVIKFPELSGDQFVSALKAHVPKSEDCDILNTANRIEKIRELRKTGDLNTRATMREAIACLEYIQAGMPFETAFRFCVAEKFSASELETLKSNGIYDNDMPNNMTLAELIEQLEQIATLKTQIEERDKKLQKLAKLLKDINS